MRLHLLAPICLLIACVGVAGQTRALAPVLFFSDLILGANTGNSDPTFSSTGGVYVTLYGNYLDNFSSITLNGSNCLTVVSKPAPWLWYQRMTVKLGTSCTTGNWSITTPGGTFTGPMPETTNEQLAHDFQVDRGHIYYVATGGRGRGTFSSPFGTLSAAESAMADGDVTYVKNGFSTTSRDSNNSGWGILNPGGPRTGGQCASSFATQRAIGAYPGATVITGSTSEDVPTFKPYNENCEGYELFGLTMRSRQGVISLITGRAPSGNFRFVANDESCPGGNGQSGCYQDGGINGALTGVINLGNNMHDTGFGGNALYQGYYHGDTNDIIDAWGQIYNLNGACRGIQIYSSTPEFQFRDIHIHDNIIHDTGCDGILFSNPTPTSSGLYGGGVEAYNNVIYNTGTTPPEGGSGDFACIEISYPIGPGVSIEVYNNTMFNCGTTTNPPYAGSNAGVNINFVAYTTAKINFRNNIIYNQNSGSCRGQTPCSLYIVNGLRSSSDLTGANNIMYGVGKISRATVVRGSALTGSINSDPGFKNTNTSECPNKCPTNLGLSSPSSVANGAGATTRPVPTYDVNGLKRPSPPSIGAYEYLP